MAFKQRQQQRFPHLSQWVRSSSAAGLGGFGLQAAGVDPVSTAHRDARRCGSHLLAAAGSSFGHVQRNLLSGEGSRHDPVPCAWQPDSAQPLQSGQPVWRDPSTRLSSDTPWQNGFAESFNSRFRDEFLNTELFATVAEAQGLANRWRWEDNNLRPHSAFQGRTPLEAAQIAAA